MRMSGTRVLAAVTVAALCAIGSVTQPARATDPAPVAGLRVQGNLLVDASGQPVRLRGVNRSGTEYMCLGGGAIFDGPSDAASIAAILSWRTNAVRIPLNEDCWLGINGVPAATSGAAYQQAIEEYVDLLGQNGLYAILDLHWTAAGDSVADQQEPMPDLDHAPAFWSSVASAFQGNGTVIFDLFNEPYPDALLDSTPGWTCWRDGGTCDGLTYAAAGMQTLVNAVRSTGATNVIALGGLGWSNFLSGWLHYRPSDPQNAVVAAWHTYDFAECTTTDCLDATVAPVAAQVPVIAAEIGDDQCDASFLNAIMGWLDAHQIGYLVWAWDAWGERYGDPDACYSFALIRDYSGTPTTYGSIIKAHLAQLP